MADKQVQKAGPSSQQFQIGTVVIGVDEKRAREIANEQVHIALKDFTTEAAIIANKRSEEFNSVLIERMVQEKALAAFSDPSFQILLIEAQKRAASSEREQDYDLLSELMVYRFQKGSNRNIRVGISRAVEIVDQISDDALLGITVFHSVTNFIPLSGYMEEGLKVLDDLFSKVIYGTLPTNNDWLDHLDILDAIRISSFGNMKLLEDFWYDHFDGYLKNGIEIDSEKHKEAIDILKNANLSLTLLVKNTFNEKYVKLELLNKNRISNLIMEVADSGSRSTTESERIALEKVYDLYDGNKMSKEDFIKEIERYQSLKILREWWNTLQNKPIQITSVGRVLAHSNAQRIDRNLPPLD